MASPELQQFLESHKPHFKLLDSGKVLCELNGHTFPANIQCLTAFVNGHKYQRLRKTKEVANKLDKYEPFIVPSKNFPTMLYCALTGQLLEKSVEAVQKHLKGKKSTKAKARFESNTLELRPEPDVNRIVESLREDEELEGEELEEAPGAAQDEEFWVPGEKDASASGNDDEDEDMQNAEEQTKPAPSSNGKTKEKKQKQQDKQADKTVEDEDMQSAEEQTKPAPSSNGKTKEKKQKQQDKQADETGSTARLKKRPKVKPPSLKKQKV